MEPTRRSERTDLENQAGSPFQDVLVGWEGHSPTRRSERTGLSPGRFTLPGYPGWVGRWVPLAEASKPAWKSRPVHPSRISWLGGKKMPYSPKRVNQLGIPGRFTLPGYPGWVGR